MSLEQASAPVIAGTFRIQEQPGATIGRYRLLQQIGEGGMGVVYMAEQTEPVVRKVALKIIKLGMDTKQVVARFEAERQALALMDHPNIAKVLDAGATETGRPYFAMELVHGVPITEYCDKSKLSTQQRLELFIPVCQAIQHAHQKGIIHRDIKPSNVMVTLHDGVPVPKVIDFGVAKATNQRLTERTLFTDYAQVIGTPAYMSPEQAEMSGLDIDTRSDIYSLGVLLYELLTGTTPFDTKDLLSKGYAEMQRIIAEQEPPKPSTRMSTLTEEQRTVVAAQRSTDAWGLRRVLQGDLDWIVMKCLEKDRTRRYESSNGLAADLRRHLRDELVTARPPGANCLIRKLIRRHKVVFAAGTAIAISLLVGISMSGWQAIRARRAEFRALSTVQELRQTAPAFAQQARALVAQSRFEEAIGKLDYAIRLRPDIADYVLARANLHQCCLRFPEAAEGYQEALRGNRNDERAKANLRLTEELLAGKTANQGKVPIELLARLQAEMAAEHRSAAELAPVSVALAKEREILFASWLDRLKGLPIPADKPLKDRLAIARSGRLTLDLSMTPIRELTVLREKEPINAGSAGIPGADSHGISIESLDLRGCRNVTDLSPLRDMPLRALHLSSTGVTNLEPLRGMAALEVLDLDQTKITELDPLKGLCLRELKLANCAVTNLEPLAGMPLDHLNLRETRVASLAPLRGMPLKLLDLTGVPARDFEALRGLPLETLLLQNGGLTNLELLADLPLKKLSLFQEHQARNYAALARIKSLNLLLLPGSIFSNLPEEELVAVESLKDLPGLTQVGMRTPQLRLSSLPSSEDFWAEWGINRLMHAGRYREAATMLRKGLEDSSRLNGPNDETTGAMKWRLASCLMGMGRPTEAALLMGEMVRARLAANPHSGDYSEAVLWRDWSTALVDARDAAAYQRLCTEMVRRYEGARDQYFANLVIKVCSMAPGAGVLESQMGTFEVVSKGMLDGSDALFHVIDLAAWRYRTGRFQEAEQLLTNPTNHLDSDDGAGTFLYPQRDLLLAMARLKLSPSAQVRDELERARRAILREWPPAWRGADYVLWDWSRVRLLADETGRLSGP